MTDKKSGRATGDQTWARPAPISPVRRPNHEGTGPLPRAVAGAAAAARGVEPEREVRAMRVREAERLARMVLNPPRVAPKWVTPEMVKQVTPLEGLDIIARGEMRTRRVLLLCAVMRRVADDLRRYADELDP